MNLIERLSRDISVPVRDRPFFAFDTETHKITSQNQTPPLVCLSTSEPRNGKLHTWLYNKGEGVQLMRKKLSAAANGDLIIIGQNLFYDFGILCSIDWDFFAPLIFQALDVGAVYDTWLGEQILDIAWGSHKIGVNEETGEMQGAFHYNLDSLAKRHLGYNLVDKKGPDAWRLRYHELDGVSTKDYPEEAALYPMNDSKTAYLVTEGQLERAELLPGVLDNLPAQCQAYWGLHLTSVWGMNVDKEAAVALDHKLMKEMIEMEPELFSYGFIKHKKEKGELKVSRDMKTIREAVFKSFNGAPPMSDPSAKYPNGQVKTDSETLQDCNDPRLYKTDEKGKPIGGLWYYSHKQKIRAFVSDLEEIVHPRYGLAASGRSTSYGINIQNLPRADGVRQCFVPPEGCVLSSTDYNMLEMCTFAQIQLWVTGRSPLATSLNAGQDPHLALAAHMLKTTYDDVYARKKEKQIKDTRQLCKVPNFGYPGGMGWKKLIQFARASYNLRITEQDSRLLKSIWMGLWQPKEYFDWVASRVEGINGGQVTQFVSNRIRGGVGYTDACNTFFQGLAADGAKAALYQVVKEMCLNARSPIYGSRVHAFVHDELVCSHDREYAHEAAMRVREIMVEQMQAYTPDVIIRAEPCLMYRWEKDAEPVYVNNKLVPWMKVAA